MGSGPANYPSPTQQHASPAYGPFYGAHQQHNGQQDLTAAAAAAAAASGDDMAADARLRNELTRQINHPQMMNPQMMNQPLPPRQSHDHELDHEHNHKHNHEHDGLQQQLSDGRHDDTAAIMEQDVMRNQSPGGQLGVDNSGNQLGTEVLRHLGGSAETPGNHLGGAETPGHKDRRSKVSRACDECRRKKIRCDAPDESGASPCSSCRRTGAPCAFSRQPMKRGPSKGYIKELAERLNALEGQIHPHHGHQTNAELHFLQQSLAEAAAAAGAPRRDPDLTPDANGLVRGRKRTHSQSESFTDTPTHQPRFPSSPYNATATAPSNSSLAPTASMQPPALQPFFRYGGDYSGRREAVATPYDSDPTGGASNLIHWDDEVVDEYYRIIHQTFPLLPHSKHNLRRRLATCSVSLREAFLMALECTMRTFPSPTSTLRANNSYAPMLKRAAELLAGYPFDNPSAHTNATNLVYLQTLLLMALESDNHGPATIRGQAGPSRSEWLGRAAGVAGQLEINLVRPRERFVTDGDPDSEERVSRRVWWVLFILDRWHASSTADLLKLPENSVVLLPEDQILLGESTYHLARLSFIIGHLAAILTTTKTPETNVMAPSNPASQLLGLTLAGEIDRFRESVESVWGTLNLVHLCYHHCHLLIKRLNPTTEPTEMIGHAVKVATVLNQRQTPITPLNHHFAALSAMTLCELVDIEKTSKEAARGIEQISEALGLGRGFAGHEQSTGWDSAIRELVIQKKAVLQQREQLQQQQADDASGGAGGEEGGRLEVASGVTGNGTPAASAPASASATTAAPSSAEQNVSATSIVEPDGTRGKFDPTMLTRYGYLTALGQGMFNVK